MGVTVVTQGVAEYDILDVLSFDQHVDFADRIGLGVEFLPEQHQASGWVQCSDILFAQAQHAAGASRGIVQAAHDTGDGQDVVVKDKEQGHHEPDHVALGVVFAGCLIGEFGKAANQVFEDQPHLVVVDDAWVQINRRELLHNLVEQVGAVQLFDLHLEIVALEDIAGVLAKATDIADQICLDIGWVCQQPGEVQFGTVGEALVGFAQQEGIERNLEVFARLVLFQDGWLGRVQHAIDAA